MFKIKKMIVLAGLLSQCSLLSAATIQGWVFRDVNGNGLRDADVTDAAQDTVERGISGVTIAAINAAGVSVAGTYTSCTGRGTPNVACNTSLDSFYTITVPDNASYRIEMSGLSALANGALADGIQATGTPPAGQVGSNSAVQFVTVTTGTTSNINFAVQSADQFCAANPNLAVPKFMWRGQTGTLNATLQGFVSFGNGSGTTEQGGVTNQAVNTDPTPINVEAQNIGPTWGVARDRRFNTLFAGAFTRRHVPFLGANVGIGRIYRIPATGGATVPSTYVDFESAAFRTAFPDAVSRDFGGGDRDPHDNTPNYLTDTSAWDEVGKTGFGDIDISPDGQSLYAIALQDRRLYRIPVLASGSPTAAQVSAFSLPNPAPVCTNGVARPFALAFHDNRGYVGLVCTAESVGGTAANLRAVVFEFNPAAVTPTFTQVFDLPLNYGRGCASQNSGGQQTCTTAQSEWRPWTASSTCGTNTAPYTQQICPQPVLSDILFDEYGYVTMLVGDRNGWQSGNDKSGAGTTEGTAAGEILRVERNAAGAWTVESQGQVTGMTRDAGNIITTQLNPAGSGAGTSPNGLEWYWHDDYNTVNDGIHSDVTVGGGAIVPGSGEVIAAAFDPVPAGPFRSGGVAWFSNWRVDGVYNYGERTRSYLQFPQDETGTFGKAAGLGDIEAICGQAPIQIGNRVWNDLDADGVQDAGEPGLSGVVIRLSNAAGTVIGQTTTDANGNWYFTVNEIYSGTDADLTDATVNLLSANLYGQQVFVTINSTDSTGAGTAGALNNLRATTATASSGASGVGSLERDSNGVIVDPPGGAVAAGVGASVTLPSTPGIGSHSVDFGFVPTDYGDLPDTTNLTGAGNYQTLLANGGPSNLMNNALRLGVAVGTLSTGYDSETDGVSTTNADGDNLAGDNDENGLVTFPALRPGVAPTVTLSVFNNTGATRNLCGFIDFNNDGDFVDAGEFVSTTVNSSASQQNVNLVFTGSFTNGQAFANNFVYSRFRVQESACSSLNYGGIGEVEDYAIPVANVNVALSAIPNYCPGGSVSYTITYTNPSTRAATAYPVTADLVGSNEPNLAGAPVFAVANWAVTGGTGGSLAASSGSGDINTTATIPAGQTVVITVQGVFANTTSGLQSASADIAPSIGSVDSNSSDDTASAASTQNPAATCTGSSNGTGALCPNLGSTGVGALNPQPLDCNTAGERVVNTYYPSVASVAANARCLSVGTPTGSGTAITTGNVLLIVQMQGATIDSTNDLGYGDNVNGAPGGALTATAGQFEYVIAQSGVQPTGSTNCPGTNTVEITGSGALNSSGSHGLRFGYTHDTASAQRSVYQVVRVPVHTSVSFSNATCSIGASAWNGSTGGIVSLDATQGINLGSSAVTRINAAADGFRGAICAVSGSSSTLDLFASGASTSVSGKGEGYAGTPVAAPLSGSGYTGGDFGRGAPGNAGGSGQRCNGGGNARTSGGGGGAGRSPGGVGGSDSTGGTCTLSGHGGGVLPANNDASRLVMGGGGGAGATTDACNGTQGTGGGIVLLRARELSGVGTITAAGSNATGTSDNNTALGGGGGGGTIILMTNIAGANDYGSVGIDARGGNGGAGTIDNGAGGGGGAGNLYRSPVAASTPLGSPLLTGGTVSAGTGAGAGTDSTVGSVDPVNGSPGVKPSYICAQNSTVPVTLSYVDVRDQAGELLVNFHTATEAGTLGYRILADLGVPGREVQARVEIGAVASRHIDSLVEQSYQVRARNPGASQIWIEESSVDGKSELYGPYPVGQAIGERGLTSEMNWGLVQAEQSAYQAARATGLRSLGAKIAEVRVDRDQWVQLSHADLLAVGVDLTGVQSKDIAVRKGSETIPAQVTDGAFGAGSTIAFFAPAVSDSIYTRTAVYRIEQGRGLTVPTLDVRGRGDLSEIRSANGQTEFASNAIYSFSSPLEDPWFSFRAMRSGGASVGVGSVELVIKDLVESTSRASVSDQYVEVSYWGGLDYAGANADHHAVFKLNGVSLGEAQFDGFAPGTQRFALPPNVLKNGSNAFSVEVPNTTGYAADIVNIESVSLHYARRLLVQNDQLDIVLPATPATSTTDEKGVDDGNDRTPTGPNESLFVVEGLSSTPVVALVERGEEVFSLVTDAPQDGRMTLKLNAKTGDRLRILPVSKAGSSLRAVAAVEDPIAGAPASYLIVSHPSFIDALGPMVLAKQQQGFSVKVVDVESVYRYYSAGVVDPAAIQLAIRRAKSTLGTTHVLLVGGDSSDYLNVLGINSISFIPTNYRRTDPIIAWAPSDAVYADTDSDGASDVALGRWPVRTIAELNAIMSKTLSYQNRYKGVFVADRSLGLVSYASEMPKLAESLGGNWQNGQVSLDDYAPGSASQARAELVNQLAAGASLLTYYGHSAPASWSREGLLSASLVYGGLFNSVEQPFATLQLGCWGTYFVEPTRNTIAHALLLQPHGSAAVLGASSLTASTSDLALANDLMPRLNQESFGVAAMQAQSLMLQAQPLPLDVIYGLTLLGDPALK